MTLQRALDAVQAVLLPDAQVVLLLGAAEPEALVATVIGGDRGGPARRRRGAASSESGIGGAVVFAQPQSGPAVERDVAIATRVRRDGAHSRSRRSNWRSRISPSPCSSCAASRPRFDRILGEVLLGLDHLGHLRGWWARGRARPMTRAHHPSARRASSAS